MSDELVVPSGQSKYMSPEVVTDFGKGGGFLPRIQVAGGNSAIVKEKKIGIGEIALVQNKNVTSLGTQAVALILGWRPKALRYGGGSAEAVYNPQAPLFVQIRDGALAGGQNNPNQFGPEFLLWFTEHKQLALFFHGNITLRNEGTVAIGYFQEQQTAKSWIPVQFTIDYIDLKKKNQSWHTTRITKYASTVPADSFPPADLMNKEIEKFNNPKEDVKEQAEGGSSDDRG